MSKHWSVQDAKAKLSQLLRAAEKEPQIITYRGEPKFEVRAKGAVEQNAAPKGPPRWWLEAPRMKRGLKLPARSGKMRKVEL
jgi:antitoxin (DNA-binding transcriptional repressor) of toxin-antitoxin stability system